MDSIYMEAHCLFCNNITTLEHLLIFCKVVGEFSQRQLIAYWGLSFFETPGLRLESLYSINVLLSLNKFSSTDFTKWHTPVL